jgi:hypothetical protein
LSEEVLKILRVLLNLPDAVSLRNAGEDWFVERSADDFDLAAVGEFPDLVEVFRSPSKLPMGW